MVKWMCIGMSGMREKWRVKPSNAIYLGTQVAVVRAHATHFPYYACASGISGTFH